MYRSWLVNLKTGEYIAISSPKHKKEIINQGGCWEEYLHEPTKEDILLMMQDGFESGKFIEKDVWTILNKEKWNNEGVRHIENLHDAIVRIFEKADIKDLQILSLGIDTNLYEVINILTEYTQG